MSTASVSERKSSGSGKNQIERRRQTCSKPVWHCYQTCGLLIRSQLELPELDASDPNAGGEAQVEIVLGQVPRHLEGARRESPWLQADSGNCLIDVEHVARYLIQSGHKVIVDRRFPSPHNSGKTEGDVRTYLLGTVLGALLHQRQLLPLHVSAVRTSFGTVAFTGPSGAGKSTLAACLHQFLDLPLVTDDIGSLNPTDPEPVLHPGPPRLKLWEDTLDSLEIGRSGLVQDLSRTNKFHLRQKFSLGNQTEPLTKLVILSRAKPEEPTLVRRIRGIEAYRVFMHSIYRPALCKLFFNQANLHDFGGRIAGRIEVFEYRRPWELDTVESSLPKLLASLS
jgi:hypothetical protein